MHLTFFRRGKVCFPMDLYGKNVENFKWPPLEPLGQCCSNFIRSLTRAGEWKIAKIVAAHWPSWLPCPYIVKIFKNLLLQDRGCLVAESLHKSSETGGLPKLLKWWSYIDIWPFYGVKFASVCICMGPIHLYGKMLIISNDFSSEANVAQISCGASFGQENERLLKWAWSIDQNGCHAYIC